MKIDDIIALTKAGFTKEEIMQLETGEAPKEEANNNEQNEASSIQPEPQKEPAPVKEDPRIDTVIEKLEKLTSGMENLALKNTQMPERETADDALARIINPYLTTGTGGINNGSK